MPLSKDKRSFIFDDSPQINKIKGWYDRLREEERGAKKQPAKPVEAQPKPSGINASIPSRAAK